MSDDHSNKPKVPYLVPDPSLSDHSLPHAHNTVPRDVDLSSVNISTESHIHTEVKAFLDLPDVEELCWNSAPQGASILGYNTVDESVELTEQPFIYDSNPPA